MLKQNADGRWELPDGRELYPGNSVEVQLERRWLVGRVIYQNEIQRFGVALDGGMLLVTSDLEMRFPYDALKPKREDFSSLWTVEEVAAYLRMLPATIRAMARRRELPTVRIGHAWRFRPKDIMEWVDDHSEVQVKLPGDATR
jgi:excisionase family DNA binding protein